MRVLVILRSTFRSVQLRKFGTATRAQSLEKWNMPKTEANYTQLSPISFLRRAERTYPNHVACVHGRKSFTWKELAIRAR